MKVLNFNGGVVMTISWRESNFYFDGDFSKNDGVISYVSKQLKLSK